MLESSAHDKCTVYVAYTHVVIRLNMKEYMIRDFILGINFMHVVCYMYMYLVRKHKTVFTKVFHCKVCEVKSYIITPRASARGKK